MFDIRNAFHPVPTRTLDNSAQTTLRGAVAFEGLGVHSNEPARLTVHPAAAGTGLTFAPLKRRDPAVRPLAAILANVSDTRLQTTLGCRKTGSVATIEHLMAACAGLGIDNARIEIEGPEVPAFDGSAAAFVAAFDEVGRVELSRVRRSLRILKAIRVEQGRSFAEFRPAACGLSLDVEIDFPNCAIGYQRKVLKLDPGTFRRELARARTFGFIRDLEALQNSGLALGASLRNTIAIEGEAVLNPEGLRFPDEFVRHKMLDVVGDLALAGAPIIGSFRSSRGGHALNVAALRALFADPSACRIEIDASTRHFAGM